jgi:Flp pilus assembly protein TadG
MILRRARSALGSSSCRRTAGHGEQGAATAEFVLITALLMLLFMSALQLGVALHARNLAQDAAVHGARYGALADRGPEDARLRARELMRGTLNSRMRPQVTARGARAGERGTVTVTVRASVPVLGFLPGPRLVTASATATRSSS